MEYQLLYPKIGELADKESVFAAAVDGVDRAEFLEQPSGTAKFAEDRSVQAHLKYLTGDIDIVPRIGIGNVEDGIGSLVDAHRLWVADVRKHGLEGAVVVKHLDPLVAAIARVDVALRVHRNTENISELAGAIELEHPRASVREGSHGADRDGRMPRACIDENVALGIGGDARDFAEIKAGGQVNRARNGMEFDLGCRVLGEREGREQSASECDG